MSEVALLDCPDERPEERVVLEGDEAIELWLKGKDAWNKWVEENPEANVSFESVDFSKYRAYSEEVSFEEFCFPNGVIDFSFAMFGDGKVNFFGARFGHGEVFFSCAKFGYGMKEFKNVKFGYSNVHFTSADFGEGYLSFRQVSCYQGNIDFSNIVFGDGAVVFDDSSFCNGYVSFSSAKFGSGSKFFKNVKFGTGKVKFSEVKFGCGDIIFCCTDFGVGDVDFTFVKFGDGEVNFSESKFGTGDVDFSSADLGEGNVDFSCAEFRGVNCLFEKLKFEGFATFINLTTTSSLETFSFKHSVFEKSLDLSSDGFYCIPDLTSTKVAHQISLAKLKCHFNRKGRWFNHKVVNADDIARLRRLKEIAEDNKDHTAALRFHADEMRAKRWREMGTEASLLDMCFSGLSNYGQSIARPFVALCTLMFVMTFYAVGYAVPLSLRPSDYTQWLSNMLSIEFSTWLNGFDLAISSALPFISSSRNVHMQAEEALQGILPDYFGAVSLVYGGLCFLFLFLIGLGLRNRFRI